jgi:hypothetical protein
MIDPHLGTTVSRAFRAPHDLLKEEEEEEEEEACSRHDMQK